MKIIKQHFSDVNKLKMHRKKMRFKVLQVACANGKGINELSAMIPKSISKSIANQYKINAWKNNATIIENHQNGGNNIQIA